jgi:hypothetical protein
MNRKVGKESTQRYLQLCIHQTANSRKRIRTVQLKVVGRVAQSGQGCDVCVQKTLTAYLDYR